MIWPKLLEAERMRQGCSWEWTASALRSRLRTLYTCGKVLRATRPWAFHITTKNSLKGCKQPSSESFTGPTQPSSETWHDLFHFPGISQSLQLLHTMERERYVARPITFPGQQGTSFELDQGVALPWGGCSFQSWSFISEGNLRPNSSTYPWEVLLPN